MKRALVFFLRERVGWIILFLLQWLLIIATFSLTFYFHQEAWILFQQEWGYTLILSGVLLVIFLVIQFIQWYPFYRRCDQLLKATKLSEFSFWDQPKLVEHQRFSEVAEHLYQIAIQEQKKYVEAHQQHLEYMNIWVHEMKMPLASLSLMLQKISPGMFERDDLKSMEEEVEKLNEGLDMVLNMARLNDFSLDYQIRPVSLLDQVRQVIQGKKKAFIRLGIFPKLEVADDKEWIILTDSKWNRFVIEQIVQNALKYASQMGKRSYLTFRLHKESQRILLDIQDQGPGIPKQDLPRIFDPFFTGENGRRFAQATGMGLYLVKKVLTALNHEIAVTSEEGKGTTFTLIYSTNP
ncbi:sensor histidine kinase [Thermoflavimicrobium dichotomicum]|uniref:histidine kinase n=1 Tax=Thermoflavimicrobium dichotomicum TaxID=46223 RepID=A0A1I3LUW5_9BACL|nr:sensor histidine kinase [Thermoflavimicrobium dichotomicum]SFI88551.1 Signal transduction histidine kinase [Thermoflavimicrobium dichotomicum]